MDFQTIMKYLKGLAQTSPAGMIGQATNAGAQAAGVPAGATPLTDALGQGVQNAAGAVGNALPAMPDSVAGAVNTGNQFLDSLHDRLFRLIGGRQSQEGNLGNSIGLPPGARN